MRRRRDYEMVWKNSWRRKESHLDHPMHRCSGGDWNRAPEQSCHYPFRMRKCFFPLIHRNSNWLGLDRRSAPPPLLSLRSPLLELSVSELSSELDPDDESEVDELSELESLHFPDLDDFFFLLFRSLSLFFRARRFSFFFRSFCFDLGIFSSSFKCFLPGPPKFSPPPGQIPLLHHALPRVH